MPIPTAGLREEHAELLPKVESLRAAADRAGEAGAPDLLAHVDRALEFLTRELIPHARAEDAVLYPEVDRLLAPGATHTMVLDHEEVAALTEELAGLRERLAGGGFGAQDVLELRRILYGLYTLVKLHFHKEEAAYLPLLDRSLDEARARELFGAMEAAAGRIKAQL